MVRVLLFFVLSATTAAYARGQDLVVPARMTLEEALRLANERNHRHAHVASKNETVRRRKLLSRANSTSRSTLFMPARNFPTSSLCAEKESRSRASAPSTTFCCAGRSAPAASILRAM